MLPPVCDRGRYAVAPLNVRRQLLVEWGHEHDLTEKRTLVFGLLADVPGLTTVQKLDVTELIGAKVERLDIFMGLDNDARALYALLLLDRAKGPMDHH